MPLTEAKVCNAKSDLKPKRFYDGKGLLLLVNPNGSRYWRWKYRYNGKEKMLSLGVYPDVSLKQARRKRDELRSILADGVDPSEVRKAEKDQARQDPARFQIDHEGSLSICLDRHRRVALTPNETRELRTFLAATSEVGHALD
ncbi:MAG: Arm DNA-binding domain-containing protein [Gammaproteobacteria bacterium]